jgi:hypothetical protein
MSKIARKAKKPSLKAGTGRFTVRGGAIRDYAERVNVETITRGLQNEHDDLPYVKIPTPAVKPKGVTMQQIRKAVRKAVQEYSERPSKPLGRSEA